MSSTPLLIEETNLSDAWCKIVEHIVNNPGNEITPLLLTLTNFNETNTIKEILNSDLVSGDETSIDTVSETIFPGSLYQLCKFDRHALFEEYKRNLPRIHKLDRNNARGTYFGRLVDFHGTNQLEIIIESLLRDRSVRRSKLQASIWDPNRDHINNLYQGFPCLQHVTFFVSHDGGLILNSFYALQLLYRKAYGNWLGLINLGRFVAKELDIELERFNCYVGVEELGMTKTKAKGLLEAMGK